MGNGAPGGIRTPDPLLRRQMHYPFVLRARNPFILNHVMAISEEPNWMRVHDRAVMDEA